MIVKPQKNADGTFNHFEMKGGTFEDWRKTLHEVSCRADRSADVFKELDSNDINGTAVALGVLSDISNLLGKLLEDMEKYREKAFYE